MPWCRNVVLRNRETPYGCQQGRVWRQREPDMEPATHQEPSHWESSTQAWKQEEVRRRKILLGEDDTRAVFEKRCRVWFCLQASAAAIIPFSGAFVGEFEPPLLLRYVHIIGLSECRLVRWSITAWPTVSSQRAFYEAFTGARVQKSLFTRPNKKKPT